MKILGVPIIWIVNMISSFYDCPLPIACGPLVPDLLTVCGAVAMLGGVVIMALARLPARRVGIVAGMFRLHDSLIVGLSSNTFSLGWHVYTVNVPWPKNSFVDGPRPGSGGPSQLRRPPPPQGRAGSPRPHGGGDGTLRFGRPHSPKHRGRLQPSLI